MGVNNKKNPEEVTPTGAEVSPEENSISAIKSEEAVNENSHSRENWGHPCEFFLSCLGYAVGFGNVWRFPYLCFKNGGAVFLIPYTVMLIAAGIPMFFLELALGQYVSLGPNILFPELAPIFSGIGWAMLLTTAMVAIYYNMVFAWSLFYTFASFKSVLPWSHCNNEFNSINCFTYHEANACKNMSMYFYNKTCHAIEEFCSVFNMEIYNETHCYNGTNGTEVLADIAVPLVSSSEDFYKNRMLRISGTSWENMGNMNWEIAGCLGLAWIIVCICMIKGVKSSGKVVYFTAIFPYVVLVVLLIRGLTLKGAYQGIQFYIIQANFTKLQEVQVWNDAASQIFFSLSTAYGGLITLSSYNKFRNNCMRDAIMISFSNCLTSIFAGFVIFSILGFMADEINVPVKDVVDSGSGLAFVAYPAAVARMPYPPVWAVLFFFMLITLGIDSQFTFVETLATGLFDKFPSSRSQKPLVMICLCFVMFLLGLPLCLEGGIYLFELINTYAAGLSILFIAICEVICVAYLYGFKNIMYNIKFEMGIPVPQVFYDYWSVTWLFFTPVSLIVIFALGIYYFEPVSYGTYVFPDNIQTLGWFMTVASLGPIPLFAIYVLLCSGKKGKELINHTDKFCPAYLRDKKMDSPKEDLFKFIQDNPAYVPDIVPSGPSANGIEMAADVSTHI